MASHCAQPFRRCEPALKTIALFLVRSDSRWWFIVFNLSMLFVCSIVELDAAEAEESAEPLSMEWYASGFLMRSYPIGDTLKFEGDKIPDTRFDRAKGGGLKIGVFPSYKSVFGAEVEVSGHRGSITAPQTMSGGTVRFAQVDTTQFNLMANALARYPGDLIQPYTGIGLGFSIIETDGQTQSSSGSRDPGTLFGATVQGIIGVRVILTDFLFGFVEYKPTLFEGCGDKYVYFGSGRCKIRQTHSLTSQSHSASVGVGFHF